MSGWRSGVFPAPPLLPAPPASPPPFCRRVGGAMEAGSAPWNMLICGKTVIKYVVASPPRWSGTAAHGRPFLEWTPFSSSSSLLAGQLKFVSTTHRKLGGGGVLCRSYLNLAVTVFCQRSAARTPKGKGQKYIPPTTAGVYWGDHVPQQIRLSI